jgi:hypothetical protein
MVAVGGIAIGAPAGVTVMLGGVRHGVMAVGAMPVCVEDGAMAVGATLVCVLAGAMVAGATAPG